MKIKRMLASALTVCMLSGLAGCATNTEASSATAKTEETETAATSSSETTTSEATSATSESAASASPSDYKDCIDSCLWFLESEKKSINAVGKVFSITELVGTSDLNGDGLPELYYFSEDTEGFSAKFSVRSYLPYAGEMADYIVIPNVMYQAGSGGGFIFYKTDKEVVLTTWGGEDMQTHFSTEVHSLKDFSLIASYSEIEYEDYNYETGESKFRYECKKNNGETISKEDYDAAINDLVSRTNEVIIRNFDPGENDPENKLKSFKPTGLKTYDAAVEYLKSLS